MIIKDTPWEKRNLGVVSSLEYYFDRADDIEGIRDIITKNSQISYQVAHVSAGRIDIVNYLVEDGFRFAETKIQLSANLKNLCLPSIFTQFSEELNYHRASEEEVRTICKSMQEGLFYTDKVALDPRFSPQISGKRYSYQTNDFLNQEIADAFIVNNNSRKIGFFIIKRIDKNVADSFLAGLFDRNKDSGIGFSVLFFPMLESKKQGYSKIITGVSSNNPDSLKMQLELGYRVKGMDYTLIKHV